MSKLITENRKARFDYEIMETFECGIVLRGTEMKPLRDNKASISEAFAKIKNGELYLNNASINTYENSSYFNHEIARERKLLLHKSEIEKIRKKLEEKHLTAVPIKLYFTEKGIVKLLLGIGRGKKQADKRETIKKRDISRDIQKEI